MAMTDPRDDGVPPPDSPGPARLSFLARRGLPTGRALVGALLVTLATVGSFAIATTGDDGPTTEYLVVINDVDAGDQVRLADVSLAAMDLAPEVAANALPSTNGLVVATALHHLRTGQVLDVRTLNGAAFVDGEPIVAVHELTIPVKRDRSPDRLRRGDRVTLLALNEGSGILYTALEDALVLSFDVDAPGIINSDEGVLTVAPPRQRTGEPPRVSRSPDRLSASPGRHRSASHRHLHWELHSWEFGLLAPVGVDLPNRSSRLCCAKRAFVIPAHAAAGTPISSTFSPPKLTTKA